MAASEKGSRKRKANRPPATTLTGRENQLVALAMDVAEQQMRDGTATSQIITQFLKLGSTREILEQDKLRHENELLKARVEALASQARVEELYRNALTAMRAYSGQFVDEAEDYDDPDL